MGQLIALRAAESTLAASYTRSDASRISRVPLHRLREWDRERIIFPTVLVHSEDEAGFQYSFESLVYLRLLRMLREPPESISLFKAVNALREIDDRFGPPGSRWADARIFKQGPDVFVERPDTWEVTAATRANQRAATILFGDAFALLRERADALLIPERFQATVEIDPLGRSGMPVVRGSSLRTSTLYAFRARGLSYHAIHEYYPHLTTKEIRSAVDFERMLDARAEV